MTLSADSQDSPDAPKTTPDASDSSLALSISDLPVQRAASPATAAQARALYFNTGNAFNQKVTEVPDESFTDEPARALHPDSPTGLTVCNRSQQLGTAYPATTPLVLARYARVRAGESLHTLFVASGVVMYVMVGAGSTTCGKEKIEWAAGDVVVLPGNVPHRHSAASAVAAMDVDAGAVLWIVTNEPQLAFEHLRGPAEGDAPTELVHFPAEEIEHQVELLYKTGRGDDTAGSALIFSSTRQQASRNVLPTFLAAMNSLPPGGSQRAHRHNSVAVSLVIAGEQCHSMVDGRRKDWAPWATTVTPPTAAHSHFNGGDKWARFLIIQDGGLYNYTRALGFEFTND